MMSELNGQSPPFCICAKMLLGAAPTNKPSGAVTPFCRIQNNNNSRAPTSNTHSNGCSEGINLIAPRINTHSHALCNTHIHTLVATHWFAHISLATVCGGHQCNASVCSPAPMVHMENAEPIRPNVRIFDVLLCCAIYNACMPVCLCRCTACVCESCRKRLYSAAAVRSDASQPVADAECVNKAQSAVSHSEYKPGTRNCLHIDMTMPNACVV